MKMKFLLFAFLLLGGVINAQVDTINYLIITEYRGDNTNRCYLEISNVGDVPVQLNQFNIGHWGGGDQFDYQTGKVLTPRQDYRIPVDKELQPGESFSFAAVKEFGPRMFAKGLEGFNERETHPDIWENVDFLVHLPEEKADETDIVTENFYYPFNEQWGPGMNGFYIEQHLSNGDSIVVDQVNGMFTGENGTQLNRTTRLEGYDVAGITKATGNCILVRRFNVKQGNLNFSEARGIGLDDSEWIPIPIHGEAWRSPMWTLGNHGDYNLDENTLVSDVIGVDFDNKTLTVPWGVRRGDDIMNYFEKRPGIGWEYIMAADADSLTHAAQTGDQLLVYVCGNDLDLQAFDIVVEDPAEDANMVVPVSNVDPNGFWRENIDNGIMSFPRVTKNESGNDTIWGVWGGIPYATRVDTLLLDRLQKPSNAEWEIEYASGVAKPDLTNGDVLKVTAQNGSVKSYYISVNDYRANTDASLSSITWPDIPEFYKGLFGWVGDTIPGFSSQVFSYNVQVPFMADGIPALVARTTDENAKVEVGRASSLSGDIANRTISYDVTAEDDTTEYNYSVTLSKEKNPENLQPYYAEPFISEVINNVFWINDGYVEICNPGNKPLDLSKYMIVMVVNPDPAEAVRITNESSWLSRYDKYIPGYKWTGDEGEWGNQQYIAQLDLSVPTTIEGGDVFVLGATPGKNGAFCTPGYSWPAYTQVDVQFMNNDADCYVFENQWGEQVGNRATPCNKFRNAHVFLYKITNDSINQGLKAATDPNDFKLIDVFGMGQDINWAIAGVATNPTPDFRRKPEIYKGNTVPGVSMGVNSADDVEWDWWNHIVWGNLGFGWPARMFNLMADLGKHFMNTPTHYMSTVGSLVYKVSDGYQSPQQIKGLTTGTTVSNFITNVIKANEGQSLTLTSSADGSVLAMDAVLSLNDTLVVLSADSVNTTKYVLEVTEEGLSADALLTSSEYDIEITQQPAGDGESAAEGNGGTGTISGFEYGTTVQTIIDNVTVPFGASMSVISGSGAYVPLTTLNFDTAYVATTVSSDTYFEVLAENGITIITYQLIPQATEASAFVVSNLYSVDQEKLLIDFIPRGTNVQSFISNLVPSLGASMKVIDKWGFERIDGVVGDDDKLVVTSADGTATAVYFISWLPIDGNKAIYFAYVLSDEYSIDQVEYMIYGASGIADISEFYSSIEVSEGATAVVIDKDENVKNTGTLTGTDMVKVTSADGKIEVMYSFGQLTNTSMMEVSRIKVYPNPTNGRLNVTGLEKGQRIQIFNSFGTALLDMNVESNHEMINIDSYPAGLYLIVLRDENQLLGKFKAVKY